MSDKKDVELRDLKENGEKKEKKDEKPTSPHLAMHYYANKGDVEGMRKCYQEGGRVNVPDEGPVITSDPEADSETDKIPNHSITGDYALHTAVGAGQQVAVKEIILWEADLEAKNRIGSTALHRAVSHGQIELVQYLLAEGASIDTKNKIGNTALHLAAFCGHMEITKLLLEANATAHIKTPNNLGFTPLWYARQGGKSVQQVLLNYKPDTTRTIERKKSRISTTAGKKPLTPTSEVEEVDKSIKPTEPLKNGESSSREPSLLNVPASEPKTEIDGSRSSNPREISKSDDPEDETPSATHESQETQEIQETQETQETQESQEIPI